MFDGSLYGNWQAIITFQQMIILSDKDGTIEITPQALAARTSIPLEIIEQGIYVLEAPDANTRTPGEEGRRITRINPDRPWGWHITNHAHYRSIRTTEERREYHKKYWHTRSDKQTQHETQQNSTNLPIAVSSKQEAVSSKHLSETLVPIDTCALTKNVSARNKFVKPNLSEVLDYCDKRNNGISANRFFDHYDSNGWKVGKNPMKDWKAAIRTWEQRENEKGGNNGKNQHVDNSAPAKVERAIAARERLRRETSDAQ